MTVMFKPVLKITLFFHLGLDSVRYLLEFKQINMQNDF